MWEIRVAAAPDPVTGRPRQLSVTVHGTEADATARRVVLLDAPPAARSAELTVDRLLEAWLGADHPWKPATLVSHRSVVRGLRADAIGFVPAARLIPALVRAGATPSVVGGRFRVLRSALSSW